MSWYCQLKLFGELRLNASSEILRSCPERASGVAGGFSPAGFLLAGSALADSSLTDSLRADSLRADSVRTDSVLADCSGLVGGSPA